MGGTENRKNEFVKQLFQTNTPFNMQFGFSNFSLKLCTGLRTAVN